MCTSPSIKYALINCLASQEHQAIRSWRAERTGYPSMTTESLVTEPLYRQTPYQADFEATVLAVDETGIVLDRSLFYPMGGGQPGDAGTLTMEDGTHLAIHDTRRDTSGTVRHLAADGVTLPKIGDRLRGTINWSLRHQRMRVHTALHLLSVVIPAPVTGGSIGDNQGRLDFDLPEATIDRESVTHELNKLITADYPVTTEWITDEELDARPELIKTMSVKPPRTGGSVRLVRIGDIDLQPCGGTHVASTSEIGPMRVRKIEKKTRHNRRVSIILEE